MPTEAYELSCIVSNRQLGHSCGEMQKAARRRKARIVIADDFETLRRSLRSLLGSAVCGEAENGQQAIQRVVELHPDLVILDWTMPIISGLGTAKTIRRLAPQTKILVFSLHEADAIREEALGAGADAFLHKSAKRDVILKTIAKLLAPLDLHSPIVSRSRPGVPVCTDPSS